MQQWAAATDCQRSRGQSNRKPFRSRVHRPHNLCWARASLRSRGPVSKVWSETAESLNGTYHVRADCTGSESFCFLDTGQVVHADFVIVSQGREIVFLETDPGTLLTVRADLQ